MPVDFANGMGIARARPSPHTRSPYDALFGAYDRGLPNTGANPLHVRDRSRTCRSSCADNGPGKTPSGVAFEGATR